MTERPYTGGCLCGAIRYEARPPLLFTALCHCRMCQQWTGSAMLGTAVFARESLTITKGTPKLYASSSVSDRLFCGDCGASLYTQYSESAFAEVYCIAIGTLDEPERAPPNIHYGAESELSWMHRNDGLQRLCIDVENPAEQEALLADLMARGRALVQPQ